MGVFVDIEMYISAQLSISRYNRCPTRPGAWLEVHRLRGWVWIVVNRKPVVIVAIIVVSWAPDGIFGEAMLRQAKSK